MMDKPQKTLSRPAELATLLHGIHTQVKNVSSGYRADPRSPKHVLQKHMALQKIMAFAAPYAQELRELAKAAKRENLENDDDQY